MLTEAIIVAMISGMIALLGNVLTAMSSSKLTAYKIEELKQDFADLRERVNKHNHLVERITIAEQSIKSAHKRINEMKEEKKDGRE